MKLLRPLCVRVDFAKAWNVAIYNIGCEVQLIPEMNRRKRVEFARVVYERNEYKSQSGIICGANGQNDFP